MSPTDMYNIHFPPIVTPATYFSRNDYRLKYLIPSPTTETYKYSFYPRTVRIWNNLPASVAIMPTAPAFKESALHSIREMLPLLGSNLLSSVYQCLYIVNPQLMSTYCCQEDSLFTCTSWLETPFLHHHILV